MRDRHIPRVCRSCRAPMARQTDACWRCGTDWATERQRRPALRVIAGGALSPAPTGRADAERWANEGGHL